MADATIFQVTNGQLALTPVDEAAANYSDAWQAPGGKTAATAVLADYTDAEASWSCQVTTSKLTPSKQSSNLTIPATLCAPSRTQAQAGATSFALDFAFLQDPEIVNGLAAFLYEHDTLDAFFLLDSGDGPRAIGRVVLVAGDFLGDPRALLTTSVSLDLPRKPDILFGSATGGRIVKYDGTAVNVPV